ncbi:hypothetical protein OO015_07975 [Thermomicrobium sp. 4228-Ro]|uniref:hypothetical protein n=1 Tax=Thermomicrobium sp. 4228-Ro TaxID=2993937 RepID=UPI002249456E|nr:hypothetical protein [Thermomicrobium sp. 4228-Ro]MCX2727431.1 hypothetical protein [Thermomicrobium sp. 4228-Ro]
MESVAVRWICLVWLALLCAGCFRAPLGGPIGIRTPEAVMPTPTAQPLVPVDQLPSVFGPVTVVPTPAESTYRDDVDVRELYRDLATYADQPLRYRGTVWTVIEQGELLFVQLRVAYGPGRDDWRAIVVLFPTYRVAVDTTRLREGTVVVVWGRARTMLRFTDESGNEVEQPLLLGDRLEVVQ